MSLKCISILLVLIGKYDIYSHDLQVSNYQEIKRYLKKDLKESIVKYGCSRESFVCNFFLLHYIFTRIMKNNVLKHILLVQWKRVWLSCFEPVESYTCYKLFKNDEISSCDFIFIIQICHCYNDNCFFIPRIWLYLL